MDIQDINNKLGDLTQELSAQFRTTLSTSILDDEVLLGIIHEIAESPDKYYSIFGSKAVRLATAYNQAINSYVELDEIMMEEWEQSTPSITTPEVGEVPPPVTPDVIAFPVDPFDLPEGEQDKRLET